MTTPSEEEARALIERECDIAEAKMRKWVKLPVRYVRAALASRVSTPPSEQGSCWDEGPTLPVRDGECAPMPPRCGLQAGHLGAHRGSRNMQGVATEWITRPAVTPPTKPEEKR